MPHPESGAATTSEDVRREQRQDRPPVQEEPIADASPVESIAETPQEEPAADAGTEKGTSEATQAGAGASS